MGATAAIVACVVVHFNLCFSNAGYDKQYVLPFAVLLGHHVTHTAHPALAEDRSHGGGAITVKLGRRFAATFVWHTE